MSWRCDVPAVGLQGDARPLQLLGAALAMGYMYQGPPFRSDGASHQYYLWHSSTIMFTTCIQAADHISMPEVVQTYGLERWPGFRWYFTYQG